MPRYKFGHGFQIQIWIWSKYYKFNQKSINNNMILTFLSLFLIYFIIFDRFWKFGLFNWQFWSFNWHSNDQFQYFNQKFNWKWTILIVKLSKIVGFWHDRLIKIRFWRPILNWTDFHIQNLYPNLNWTTRFHTIPLIVAALPSLNKENGSCCW